MEYPFSNSTYDASRSASYRSTLVSYTCSKHVNLNLRQVLPLVAGAVVAVTALAGRYGIQAWQAYKARPKIRRFYEGGFQQKMTRREAALILGVR